MRKYKTLDLFCGGEERVSGSASLGLMWLSVSTLSSNGIIRLTLCRRTHCTRLLASRISISSGHHLRVNGGLLPITILKDAKVILI